MRRFALIALCSLFAACGNTDKGVELKNPKQGTSTAQSITLTNVNPNVQLGPCKNLQVFAGTEPAYSQVFNGTSACASTNMSNIVRLRVPAGFPSDTRFCLVPQSATMVYTQTCFTINGQSDITLSSPAFTSVVLLREGDMGNFNNYLRNPSGTAYPPLAFGQLR